MHKIIETFHHEITLYKLILSANTLKINFIFVNFIEQLNREKLSIRNQVKLLYFAKIQSKRDINKNTFQSIDKKNKKNLLQDTFDDYWDTLCDPMTYQFHLF